MKKHSNTMKNVLSYFSIAVLFFGVGYFSQPVIVESTKNYTTSFNQREAVFEFQDKEILWLARAIYSETKIASEMVSLAWVIRNRVETEYRGDTYKEVVLYDRQFSGLNSYARHYKHNMSIDRSNRSRYSAWNNALKIAKHVYFAPGYMRPFDIETRHFYSPVAMSSPNWAEKGEAVRILNSRHQERPRFVLFKEIS